MAVPKSIEDTSILAYCGRPAADGKITNLQSFLAQWLSSPVIAPRHEEVDNLAYFKTYQKERAMSIASVTLSSKGQVVIPKEIRDQLHWEAGHELFIETTESGVLLKSRPSKKSLRLEALRGFLKSEVVPMPVDELCQPVDYSADWAAAEKFSR